MISREIEGQDLTSNWPFLKCSECPGDQYKAWDSFHTHHTNSIVHTWGSAMEDAFTLICPAIEVSRQRVLQNKVWGRKLDLWMDREEKDWYWFCLDVIGWILVGLGNQIHQKGERTADRGRGAESCSKWQTVGLDIKVIATRESLILTMSVGCENIINIPEIAAIRVQ